MNAMVVNSEISEEPSGEMSEDIDIERPVITESSLLQKDTRN